MFKLKTSFLVISLLLCLALLTGPFLGVVAAMPDSMGTALRRFAFSLLSGLIFGIPIGLVLGLVFGSIWSAVACNLLRKQTFADTGAAE